MLSVQKNYARIFRPWDESEQKSDKTSVESKHKTIKKEGRRENRLRKIRGSFRKNDNIDQDATVSTTTDLEAENTKPIKDLHLESEITDPVANLSLCCDRLLQPEETIKKEKKVPSTKSPVHISNQSLPQFFPPNYPGFPAEYLPANDIAQTLGIPPSDPLLLESLAQGYAMELEYARIIHQENEAKLLNARKQRPKKYKCPHCQVGFSNNGQLKGHIRIHTGERPYKCDEKNCGKTFTRNEELTRHKRIHSGVRPFPCPTCGKKFGRRDHLKKHTRTHYLQAERMMPVFVPLSAVPHVSGFPYLYGY